MLIAAFGNYAGFVVGWSDWANNTLSLAYISVAFGEYAGTLFFPGACGVKRFAEYRSS